MHRSLTAFLRCAVLVAMQCSCITPTEYALVNTPSAEDVTGIQQTLSLFPVAIDLKQFDLLDAVFAHNATANFTGHSVSVGVPAIKSYLSKGLTGLISQHNLGTLFVNITGPYTATSYNWLQGSFFGTGNASKQILLDFGYYKDDLVKSNGRWLVQKRVFGVFVSVLIYFFTLMHLCIYAQKPSSFKPKERYRDLW